jgi:hypothetical protein
MYFGPVFVFLRIRSILKKSIKQYFSTKGYFMIFRTLISRLSEHVELKPSAATYSVHARSTQRMLCIALSILSCIIVASFNIHLMLSSIMIISIYMLQNIKIHTLDKLYISRAHMIMSALSTGILAGGSIIMKMAYSAHYISFALYVPAIAVGILQFSYKNSWTLYEYIMYVASITSIVLMMYMM